MEEVFFLTFNSELVPLYSISELSNDNVQDSEYSHFSTLGPILTEEVKLDFELIQRL